jgi:hypothetical protein
MQQQPYSLGDDGQDDGKCDDDGDQLKFYATAVAAEEAVERNEARRVCMAVAE